MASGDDLLCRNRIFRYAADLRADKFGGRLVREFVSVQVLKRAGKVEATLLPSRLIDLASFVFRHIDGVARVGLAWLTARGPFRLFPDLVVARLDVVEEGAIDHMMLG